MIPRQVIFDWLILTTIVALLCLSHGWAGVPDIDSKMYMTIARNMIQRDDWLLPFYHNQPFYLHPPLTFWLIAISYKIFGISLYSAKIPMALTLLGVTLLIYIMTFWLRDRRAALISGIIFATMIPVIQVASKIHLDLPLTLFVTLSVVGIFFAQQISTRWYWLTGVGTGLAILTKGLVGLSPLPILICTLFFSKKFKHLFSPHLIGGIFLAFFIPGLWIYALNLDGINWVRIYWESNMHGVARIDFENIKRGYLYFPQILLINALPWSILAIWQLFKSFTSKKINRSWLVFLFWILIFIVAFSIPNYKLPHYLLPCLPAIAILATLRLSDLLPENLKESLGSYAIITIAFISFVLSIYPEPVRKNRSGDIIPLLPAIESLYKERGIKEFAIVNLNPPHHMPYWERVATLELYLPLQIDLKFQTNREELINYFKDKKEGYALIESKQLAEIKSFIPNLKILDKGDGLMLVTPSGVGLPPMHMKMTKKIPS